jgi:glycosyltransferase involved in cell wall biosynthesis
MRRVILHCINSLAVGGAEILLRDTIRELPQFDHVICYLNKPDPLAYEFKSYPLYNLQHKRWLDSYNTIERIKKIIKQHNVNIVHAHLFNATLLSRLATPKHIPFFFTVHNILSKDAFLVNKLSVIAEKLTYKKRHYIIAISNEVIKDYDQWIGIKGRSSVLYNYVHEKYFNLSFDYTQKIKDGFRLVAVGNLRRQKNYFALLDAMSLLKGYPISLDIYGNGTIYDELQNQINSIDLKVNLMGRTDDVSKVLMNYHAYIMPSLFEGFGIAPMEAMASGMPVILSNLPVFKEIAGELPVFFNPLEAGSIAEAIKYCYENWEIIKTEAKKGRETISKIASREAYFNNLIEIYKTAES